MVVESFGPPHRRTNPYLPQLVAALPPEVDVRYRSWRLLLAGRYDVFHLHWPEVFVTDPVRLRALGRSLLFLAALVRLRLGHRALVRTLHNARPHDDLGWWARWLLRLVDRWTTLWIVLNRVDPPPTGAPAVHAPIGDPSPWFTGVPVPSPIPGRLLHFGIIRSYKGVEGLLDAFGETDDAERTLHVVGQVLDPAIRDRLDAASAADGRITVTDDYIADEDLAREVGEAELVVLPFVRVANSSSMLLALSLGRPILVPSLPLTEELASEVGAEWVRRYEGPLRAADLRPGHVPPGRPDLAARAWSRVGEIHATAFGAARALARGEPAAVPYNGIFTRDG